MLLNGALRERLDPSWLEELRELADSIWRLRPGSIEECLSKAELDFEEDYRLLQLPPFDPGLLNYLCRNLVSNSPRAENILLSGLKNHWALRRELAKAEDWDW